ncbi:DUF6144 family protein [Candidatus Bathyarchaeota archaeon]|nr:DUF6144 family protein [Candidatus Bathyarchaeota archaeon]TFH18538.1 MAG: hypothetical protein E4H04_03155 [Candidatus Bathyarchaeota archaeon]
MYKEAEYRGYLVGRGMSLEKIGKSVAYVEKAEEYFKKKGLKLTDGSVEDFRGYVSYLMKRGENSYDELAAVGRYVNLLDMKKVWIYYAGILGGNTVYPSIKERLTEIAGTEKCDAVFSGVDEPPLGSEPDAYPAATMQLMDMLGKELSPAVYRRVLAGNHHRMSVEAFMKHKEWLMELDGDVDAWLEKMHEAAVVELEDHLREDKVWYEQVITQGIVDYVKNNQELLAGIRDGEWIYNTKFPYAPQDYLDEKDPLMKRYYMCHCPLARAAVLSGEPDIPMDWCYCSAGYGKFRYDIAFGEETEVEVLESVFNGSDKCRFRFKIPEKWR